MKASMATTSKIRLRSAWYALIFAASLLPAIALSPWLSHQAHGLLLDRAILSEKLFHQTVETRLDMETQRLRSVMVNKSDPIGHFLQQHDLKMVQQLMDKILEREPMINTVTIYDLNAAALITIHDGHHTPATIDPDSPAFAVPLHQRTFIGAPTKLADHHFEFLIAVPVMIDHRPIAVMICTININQFWRSVRRSAPVHDSHIYLVDGRGSLLNQLEDSHHHQGDLLTNQPIVRSLLAAKAWDNLDPYQGFEDKEVYGIASLIGTLQWGIISEIPAGRISAPIVSALITLTLIVFFLHIIFGLTSLFFTKRLLHPISDLVRVIKRTASGDYQYHAKSSRFKEIHALTSAFNTMIHEIDHRERKLQQMYHAMDHAGEAIIITDARGRIEYINAAFCDITGYSKEESIGHPPGDLLKSGKQSAAFYQELWQQIKHGNTFEVELSNRKKDGTIYPVSMTIAPVFSGDTITHFIAIEKDMSKQNQLQEQLRQSQKMEAVGTLVGGIAHDFNNLLGGMTGNLYLAKQRIQKGEVSSSSKNIAAVEKLCKQAATMVSQLLTFSRKGVIKMEPVALDQLLKEILRLARLTIPENIHLTPHITDKTTWINGDITQLQQLMVNLLNNAKDALCHSKDPSIEVRLDHDTPDDAFMAQHPETKTEKYAHLSVTDNGIGIAQEHLDQIYDPFFTTKEVGKGTGLGLAMAFGTMKSHGGIINVESSIGAGCTIHLYFPIVDAEASKAEPVPDSEQLQADGETILLVDDDPRVRESTADVLESWGFHVLSAQDGKQALDLHKTFHDSIRLILTDIVMPNCDGMELAQSIRAKDADIPIIFMTGYDRKQVMIDTPIGNYDIFTKPVSFDRLNTTMRKMLDNAASGRTTNITASNH